MKSPISFGSDALNSAAPSEVEGGESMGAKRGEEEEEEEEGDEARILPPQGAFSRLASRQRSLPHWCVPTSS